MIMRNMKTAATILAAVCLAGALALAAANAADPSATQPGTTDPDAAAPTAPDAVMPAQSTVLPNAPKVGDRGPSSDGSPAPKGTYVPQAAGPGAAPAPAGEDGAAAEAISPAVVAGSPDWPCVQRKVAAISAAQIWDGPSIDGLKGFENDEKIRELTSYLESRRVTSEDAEKAIKEYAASLPAGERDKKLTELFASVLAKVNSDREFVMHRIETFQKRQKARAEEIEREGQRLAAKDQAISGDEQLVPRDSTLTPEQQEYNWNARIFQERQQNITLACEIPDLIEQHVYDIAKLIRAQMQS
jgi:hypothetical protein